MSKVYPPGPISSHDVHVLLNVFCSHLENKFVTAAMSCVCGMTGRPARCALGTLERKDSV